MGSYLFDAISQYKKLTECLNETIRVFLGCACCVRDAG